MLELLVRRYLYHVYEANWLAAHTWKAYAESMKYNDYAEKFTTLANKLNQHVVVHSAIECEKIWIAMWDTG